MTKTKRPQPEPVQRDPKADDVSAHDKPDPGKLSAERLPSVATSELPFETRSPNCAARFDGCQIGAGDQRAKGQPGSSEDTSRAGQETAVVSAKAL